jgi:transcriptional regulator with PAS, ATPase and Fis domain
LVFDDPTMEPATAAAPIATSPVLRIVFSGTGPVQQDAPIDGELVVGRATVGDGALRLDVDSRLSRRHAVFHESGGRVTVTNESTHGTYVNGVKIEGAVGLADGDVLRMGDTFAVLRFMPDAQRDKPIATLLGDAPAARQLRALIGIVGPTSASVVLLGETGSGKEVCARAIHEVSERKGPFIPVNCAAIPENLAESQLFGHKSGSFTGASRDHVGFFLSAHGGTLFLDEVGELPLPLQPKLLRVLDEKTVFPVGATSGTPIDVRVVCATNREIAREVERGAFRADLFARLAEITVVVPPLRARKEDVLPLLFVALGGAVPNAVLSPQLVHALLVHHWPFNVRELMKIATELSVKGQGREVLDVDLLEGRVLGPVAPRIEDPPTMPDTPTSKDKSVKESAPKGIELPIPNKDELVGLLQQHAGKVSAVARVTGRSRTQVYRWLEEHGLDPESFR